MGIAKVFRGGSQAAVIVRIGRQFVTLVDGYSTAYEPGFHKLPADKAKEFIKSGNARPVTSEDELTLANSEILRRELEAGE